jgi:hypothetical protein
MDAPRRLALLLGPLLLLLALPLLAEVDDRVPPPPVPARPAIPLRPGESPSPVIYPPRAAPLGFTHTTPGHAAAACVACHPGAPTSRRAADGLLPGAAACAACHPAKDAPASPPPPYLRSDHAAHATAGIDCGACHRFDAADEGSPARALPPMTTCLGCHDGRRAAAACRTCHLTDGAGRVRWRLPTGRLVPSGRAFDDRHDEAFLERHGRAAARDRRHCAECHDDGWCQACHDGAARPARIHPADWLALHPVPARKDPRGCVACHRSRGDCIVCHRRSHVVAEGEQAFPGAAGAGGGGGRFHPGGWTLPDGALPGATHHGREARRGLHACASCHREETCVACHRSRTSPDGAGRGVFANPHGRGFRERCAAMRSRNPAVCERCHGATDPALERCR